MLRLRATFPWLLLAASLAVNLHLWRRASVSALPYESHRPHKTPSETSAPSATSSSFAPFVPSRDIISTTAPSINAPSLNSQPSTLASTASRSSAFRGYADLLAEDVKTAGQIAALNQLLARWVATAPTDAATWLASHDDAPFYDPAALHVAKHLVASERFSEASAWADLIRDPALQEDARDAIVAESFRAKKIDASAVRVSGLPPERIAAILNGSRLD